MAEGRKADAMAMAADVTGMVTRGMVAGSVAWVVMMVVVVVCFARVA